MKIKKFTALLLVLCLTLGIIGIIPPKTAEAAWDTAVGKLSVWHLDNDYKDGKFRFNIKLKYDKYAYVDDKNCGVQITDIRLVNSSGKKVTGWSGRQVLTTSGEITLHYAVDFSQLPSDTYKFCYTLAPDYCMYTQKHSITVKHSAGSITYNSAKYEYSTTGEKKVVVLFNMKQLKGKTVTIQIFDDKGKIVKTFKNPSKPSGDDIIYKITWGMTDDSGATVKKGTYTFKITCNGKTCTKKITMSPN